MGRNLHALSARGARKFAALMMAMLLVFAGMPSMTASAAIALDTGFGTGGTVRTDFSGNIDEARAVAIQPDGKIVAAGSSFSSAKTVEDFVVARYNSNGSLDKNFGKNGKVVTDFFLNVDSISAVAIQPDGKIVVGGFAQLAGSGSTPRVFALARYNGDGSPDTSFGSGGKLTTNFGGIFASVSAIMLQKDGKIIAAGTADFNPRVPGAGLDFALARYQSNGGLDGSFGDAGKLTFDFFGSFNQANAAALQPDGKIVLVGSAAYDSSNRSIGFALARFNPDGSLDATFGSGGKQITDFFGTGGQANGVVLQPDGKIVVAGTASDTAARVVATDFALARYNTDGSLDASFGSGGQTATPLPDSVTEQGNSIALAKDGKIIVAGAAYKTFTTPPDFALARYNADGSLDASFGSGGTLMTDFSGGTDEAFAVAIQSDGSLVAAGRAYRSSFDVALARYLSDTAPTPVPTPVPAATADLSATTTAAPNPVTVGNNLTYTVNIINNGPSAANAVTLSDTLPAGVSLVSAKASQGACSGLSAVTCNLGAMVSGAGASVSIVVTPASAGTLTNTVSVSGDVADPNAANNTTTTVTNVQPTPAPTPAPTPVPTATPALVSLALNPTTVTAPAISTGTVTLSSPAGTGGLSVTLRSNDTKKATVPATVTIPAGASTATFTITTLTGNLGGGKNSATITATLAGTNRTATLNILRP